MATKRTTTKTTRSAKSTKAAPAKKASSSKATTKIANPAAAKRAATKKGLSALDAAAKVLAETKEPMNTKEMIEVMSAQKLWTSPGGKTPHATLYSAILREIKTKGKESRFKKTERGRFTATN